MAAIVRDRFSFEDGVTIRRPTPSVYTGAMTTGPSSILKRSPVVPTERKPVIAVETPVMTTGLQSSTIPIPAPVPPTGDGITDGANGIGTFFHDLFYPSGSGDAVAAMPPTTPPESSPAISGWVLAGLAAVAIVWFLKG